jgi:hypothetical protein
VPALIRAATRGLGAGKIAAVIQQAPEIEGAVGVAPFICPAVGTLRATHIAAPFEQDAEIGCRTRVTCVVGRGEGFRGAGKIAAPC